MSESRPAIGVDIGGSHIKSALVDVEAGVIDPSSITEVKIDSQAEASEIGKNWASALNETAKLASGDVRGVGFAMPGAFNYRDGIALFSGNAKYESLYGLNVRNLMQPFLKLKESTPFRYHNDASCFAIGEDGYGEGQGFSRSMSITLGTGFGSAFIDSGVPIVERSDVPQDGCLWHLPYKGGIADDYFSTRWFVDTYASKFGKKLPGVREIAEAARDSIEPRQIFDQFGSNLAEFMAPWITNFKTEIVVVGGNISGAFDLISPALHAKLEQLNADTIFKVSSLKEDAALLGSARLLNDNYFDKVKNNLPTK